MIGDNIKNRRLELGLTQEELAHKLGYKTKSAINKIEKNINDISQSKLLDFAMALDCSPMHLLNPKPASEQSFEERRNNRILYYSLLMSSLSDESLDNVKNYIEFLKNKEESQNEDNNR